MEEFARRSVLGGVVGLTGLMKGLAQELGERGINVNCVAPSKLR